MIPEWQFWWMISRRTLLSNLFYIIFLLDLQDVAQNAAIFSKSQVQLGRCFYEG